MKTTLLFLLIVSLFSGGKTASAQTYELDWFTIDGGGGISEGGPFSVAGVIGQPEAGSSSAGEFAVEGGFWGAETMEEPIEAPRLSIVRGAGAVLIAWPLSPNFQLERTFDLRSPARWEAVSAPATTNNGIVSITVPFSGKAEFFRLRR